ncbi:MAG TPA: tetratricopeptide repeat protein [Stellaceae bacterium]|nr:tetratricopeptide repeat protein [Stellaceae bacterium]
MRHLVIALLLCASLGIAPGAEASQHDKRLDALFAALKANPAPDAAHDLEQRIWLIWAEPDRPEAAAPLRLGMVALAHDDLPAADAAFAAAVAADPDFAEAWNKQATVSFLRGDFSASVTQIQHVLALEPRHFGALSGLGQIYLALDNKPAALKAFEAALAIDPALASVREAVDALRKVVGGQPI